MTYRIDRTEKANDQIHTIIMYQVELTGRVEAGLALLGLFEKELNALAQFPEMGAPPRYAALRARGYRVLIVDKFLMFYKVDHEAKQIMVYAVVDGRRDYLNLI